MALFLLGFFGIFESWFIFATLRAPCIVQSPSQLVCLSRYVSVFLSFSVFLCHCLSLSLFLFFFLRSFLSFFIHSFLSSILSLSLFLSFLHSIHFPLFLLYFLLSFFPRPHFLIRTSHLLREHQQQNILWTRFSNSGCNIATTTTTTTTTKTSTTMTTWSGEKTTRT